MTLDELRNLDLDWQNIGNAPMAAKLLIVVIVMAAVIGLGWYVDTSKQIEQLEQLESKEQELKQVVETKQKKAVNLEAYKEQLEEMRQTFGALLRQLPSQTEVADLLVDISQTGLASGLEFDLFKPQAEVPKEFYAELPIQIRVTGSYHEFGAFVGGVAALPRIVTLHDITMKPAGGDDDKKLVMEATAKTYRYLEEGEGGAK